MERNQIILERIKRGNSFVQIMNELKISYRSLLYSISELIEEGQEFDKTLFSNGTILLRIKQEIQKDYPNIININYNDEEEFRVLFISDLHIGSAKDRLDCVEKVCDYAISNKINYIFNLGDFIENTYTDAKLRLNTLDAQINCIVRNFPCDRRLTHISLYGNHDYYYLPFGGIDIAKIIDERRPDIVSLGYGRGYVKIGNDYICLEHDCPNRPAELSNISKIKFLGHSHLYKLYNENKKAIYVPALSDETPTNYNKQPLKGFLDVKFSFNTNGLIHKINIAQYTTDYNIDLCSKATIALSRNRKLPIVGKY